MSDTWATIRTAVVAKAAASTYMAAAGLRSADASPDAPAAGALPALKFQNPIFTPLDQQNAYVSEYVLEFPFELLVPVPSGQRLSGPIAADIMRAMQVEWRSGFKLGLDGSLDIVDSRVGGAAPGLSVNAETGYDGYSGSVLVQVYETHSARTP